MSGCNVDELTQLLWNRIRKPELLLEAGALDSMNGRDRGKVTVAAWAGMDGEALCFEETV